MGFYQADSLITGLIIHLILTNSTRVSIHLYYKMFVDHFLYVNCIYFVELLPLKMDKKIYYLLLSDLYSVVFCK